MLEPDAVSVHEAGHALLACALRLPLARVQVHPTPRYDLADGIATGRLDRIRVLAAGGEAERVVFDRDPIGDSGDREQIADLLRDGDDEAVLRYGVRRLLELNQGTLRYLAARLARCGYLVGHEVERIVRCR